METKVELLSPAGCYEAFIGALNAGADAVYLGGEKFGARAYADNFTTGEICRALRTAHFMGRKIYLTVNTLLKEEEMAELYDYLLPFYEAGLDGVIVQDLGVFRFIRRRFPDLPLHVSTQMTVTGAGGASFLKEQGAARIVPARELSLAEVREIKEETGMEIECFIHGAMCYCYSGQCLFSSILGGRSGNRGRCAQPCRLPYRIYEGQQAVTEEGYPLSLKDMCTLAYLPCLIEAGIDSLKIEGRMKKPEYAAGVTAVYRKYIDLYYRVGAARYRVEKEDMDRLRGLYIRSEVQTGYYERHNGREMITLAKPGYMGSDEQILADIREKFLREPDKEPVTLTVDLKAGEQAWATVQGQRTEEAAREPMQGQRAGKPAEGIGNGQEAKKTLEIAVTVMGETVQQARKAPLREEDVRKQMGRDGESCVTVTDCLVRMEGEVFLPVRALNQLRRDALEAYEREVIRENGSLYQREAPGGEENLSELGLENGKRGLSTELEPGNRKRASSTEPGSESRKRASSTEPVIDCVVATCDQLEAVRRHGCRRLYINSDLFVKKFERITAQGGVFSDGLSQGADGKMPSPACYLALPYILRQRDKAYLGKLTERIAEAGELVRGFLIRNLEGLHYVMALKGDYEVIPDAGLYCFHEEALQFWADYGQEYTLPYELNAGEAARLVSAARGLAMRTVLTVYSRIPMMVTANCLRKTADICPPDRNRSRRIYLKDRYQASFPVAVNCEHCYNIIYNSVPYFLQTASKEVQRVGADVLRYDFVMETGAECLRILAGDFPFAEHTTGHLKRGVE